MTPDLFRTDGYRTQCPSTITALTEARIALDQTVFYPLSDGQAGDTGALQLARGARIAIADTR